jgi:hypothetical protein
MSAATILLRELMLTLPPGHQERPGLARAVEVVTEFDREVVKHGLTRAQADYLARIRAHGELTFNDRARRTLERLEEIGLISVEWDYRPVAKGTGMALVGSHTARAR